MVRLADLEANLATMNVRAGKGVALHYICMSGGEKIRQVVNLAGVLIGPEFTIRSSYLVGLRRTAIAILTTEADHSTDKWGTPLTSDGFYSPCPLTLMEEFSVVVKDI